MKRLLILTFAISSFSSFAQLYFGPELGMNLIKIDEQNVGDNYQPSWYFGGALEYQLNDWLAIQSGVYFSQKRQAYTEKDTTLSEIFSLIGTSAIPGVDLNTYTTTYSRQSQSYIEIPIVATVRRKGLCIFGGGYAGFMVSANRKNNIISDTPFMSTIQLDSLLGGAGGGYGGLLTSLLPKAHEESFSETSDKTNLRDLDYGVKFGVGYQKDHFGFFASYNLGLVGFKIERITHPVQKHQYFQFSLRYMFEISKKGISSVR